MFLKFIKLYMIKRKRKKNYYFSNMLEKYVIFEDWYHNLEAESINRLYEITCRYEIFNQ